MWLESMNSEEKCEKFAGEVRNILDGGITLGSDVIHYIDSTFSNPTAAEIETILHDDFNCEKDSLMELLLFPDEAMQLQLETLLECLQFAAEEEKSIPAYLLRGPLPVKIRFPEGRGSLDLVVAEDVACRFISRLNISKHLHPELLKALDRYENEPVAQRIKVKIRNSRFSPTGEKIDFLRLFFEKFNSRDNDIFECLDFAIDFLEEFEQLDDIYRALMQKKKFHFISLQKARQMESQLRKHNVETLLARGKRVVLIDQEDARKKMRIIDRISRAIYGKTEYFEDLQPAGNTIELHPDEDIQEIIKRLS